MFLICPVEVVTFDVPIDCHSVWLFSFSKCPFQSEKSGHIYIEHCVNGNTENSYSRQSSCRRKHCLFVAATQEELDGGLHSFIIFPGQ